MMEASEFIRLAEPDRSTTLDIKVNNEDSNRAK